MLKTKYLRFPEQMVWLLEYFFRMWVICIQFSPSQIISASISSLEEFLNSKLEDYLVFCCSSLQKHLNISWCRKKVRVPPSMADHWLNTDSFYLLSIEHLALYKKFCSVGIYRRQAAWHEAYHRTVWELALLPKGEIKRANHSWHVSGIDERITRKYSDIMVVRTV